MPVPYNIFDVPGLLFLAYGCAEWIFGWEMQVQHSFILTQVPEEGEYWTCYGPQGWATLTPPCPYYNILPFNSSSEPERYREVGGWDYEYKEGVLTYFVSQNASDPAHYAGADYEGYIFGILNHLDHGRGECEKGRDLWKDTSQVLMYSDPTYGLSVMHPGAYDSFKYAYSAVGGAPLLVMSRDEMITSVSWDHGKTWSTPRWPSYYYPGSPWDGGCQGYSELAMGYGPEGSDTFCLAGGNDVWRSTSNGLALDITYASTDYAGNGLWDPAYCNAHVGYVYTIKCNNKPDPNTIWMIIAENSLEDVPGGPNDKRVQRNFTPTCEPSGWEDQAHYFVSPAFSKDIYEGTLFYPSDHPTFPGSPRVNDPLVIGITYLPGTNRWWAYEMGHYYDGHWLVFSDDDGVTWSKILCDHATPGNWPKMHPFFSPRKWPFNESYALYTSMNSSGWSHSVCDIIEHPDDPNIVITIGEYWLKTSEEVLDPGGRFDDGMAYPLIKETMPEADFLRFAEYNPYGRLQAMNSNPYCAMCISEDGGMTWGRPFSYAPLWNYGNNSEMWNSRLAAIKL